MSRISELPPTGPLTGLELIPVLQGGGPTGGRSLPLLALGESPRGAVLFLRRPMVADGSLTADDNPGAGKIRWNVMDVYGVTELYVSTTDADAVSIAAELANVQAGSLLYMQGIETDTRNTLQKWMASGPAVAAAGYVKVPVVLVAISGAVTVNQELEFTLQQPNPSPGFDRAVVTAVASSGGVTTLDASLGDYFVTTLTENTAIAVANPPAAGTISLRVQQGAGGYAVTLPAGYRTQGGEPLEVSPADDARDRIVITSDDAFATADVDIGRAYL